MTEDEYTFDTKQYEKEIVKEGFNNWYHLFRRARFLIEPLNVPIAHINTNGMDLYIGTKKYDLHTSLTIQESITLLDEAVNNLKYFKDYLERILKEND